MPDLLNVPGLFKAERRRAPWRQRLVDAERGLTQGIRGDGTLFFYLFVDSAVLAVGGVLNLSFLQWLIVGLTVTFVLALELMQQALRVFVAEMRRISPEGKWDRVQHLATASVVLAFLGGSTVVALVYWQRIAEMFAD